MNSVAASTRPTCVLVLGVHRSGTSALTRCLNLLGMDLGSNLLSPEKMNAKGFWEHADAVRINDQLLEAFGLYWYDLGPLPSGWLTSAAANAARDEIRVIVKRDFESVPLWGLKDPRLCRLAPLWIEVLQEMGIKVVSVFMIRSPMEVAESLSRFPDYRLIAPLSISHGVLLWVQDLAESVLAAQPITKAMVDYDGLLSDPVGTLSKIGRELGVAWSVAPTDRGEAIRAFLDSGLRTHHSVLEGRVPFVVTEMAKACTAVVEDPSPARWSRLAKISAGVPQLIQVLSYLGTAAGFKDRELAALRTTLVGWVPNAALYYATDANPEFSEERCLVRPVPYGRSQFDLILPAGGGKPVRLRFDPLDVRGAYVLHSLVLFDRMGQVAWDWSQAGAGVELAGITLAPSLADSGRIVAYTDIDPQISIDLPRDIAERHISMVRVDMECLNAGLLSDEILAQTARAESESTHAKEREEAMRAQDEAFAEERRQLQLLHDQAMEAERGKFQLRVDDQVEAFAEERRQLQAAGEQAVQAARGELQLRIDSLANGFAEERRQLQVAREQAIQAEREGFQIRTNEQVSAFAEERRQLQMQHDQATEAERRRLQVLHEQALEGERGTFQRRIDQLAEQLRISMESGQREIARLMAIQLTQSRELQSIHASTGWRVLLRVRKVTSLVPLGVRRQLRRLLKATWWCATPWRLPARLRFLRERKAAERTRRPEPPQPTPIEQRANPDAPKLLEAAPSVVSPPPAISFVPAHEAGQNVAGGYYQLDKGDRRYTYIPPRQPADLDRELAAMAHAPRFSIVVPVYNTPPGLLAKLVNSILAQWYPHWELILVDDNSSLEQVRFDLDRLHDPRITVIHSAENKRIAGATNEGIARASGDYVVFSDHDDELTPDCLYELARCVERENPDFIYSDEDKLDEDGRYVQPFFKPDWSPDTMMSTMYTCHVSCVRRELVNELGGLRSEYDGCQDWDFILRVVEKTARIAHVPKVLYHWRIIPASVASGLDAKPHVIEASRHAREDAMMRRGLNGVMEPVEEIPGYFRAAYQLRGEPRISIIISGQGDHQALRRCIESIKSKSTYQNVEILVVNQGSTDPATAQYIESLRGGSRIQVLTYDQPFNRAAIGNRGIQATRGELVVFINDSVEVLVPDWLQRLGAYAQMAHIGAVGAKMLYPGGKVVQHAGIVNLFSGPGYAFQGLLTHEHGYFARAVLEYNWLAVTGACLMIERSKLERIGGFDEAFSATCHDVDICFRLIEAGYYNLVSPAVKLVDHGPYELDLNGASPARQAQFGQERQTLYQKHPQFYQRDPFHSPNLAPDDVCFHLPQ